ncbi:MAG: hypothetical protein AAFX93_08005 [Verrucomicrobiota bacterium]
MKQPRSHSGKFNPIIGVVIGIVALVILVITLVMVQGGSYSGLQKFPAESYRNAPQNLLGNSYVLDAQVDSMLSYEPGLGRLLAVRADESTGRIPVFLPDGLEDSIHTGQRYSMKVNIRNGGLIYIEELKKY